MCHFLPDKRIFQYMVHRYREYLLCFCAMTLSSTFAFAQSAFAPLNDDYYHLIDRLEIKRGKLSEGFHSNVKPFERKAIVALTDSILKEGTEKLTKRDWEIIDYLREDSWEWTNGQAATDSLQYNKLARLYQSNRQGKPRKFWNHAPDLYSVHNKDLDLHFNFTTNNLIGKDSQTESPLWLTSRGVEIRGMINEKLGFYTYVSDTQGRYARYVRDFAPKFSFPGEGLAKVTGNDRTGVDFLSARGYITFRPLKSINVKFGNDYNVFGSGYRSLILSDNSSPYLFLRVDTQLGRFQYTNLWTSMIDGDTTAWNGQLRNKKFAAIHHLSVNLSKRLNIGVFEAEVFSRDNVGGGYDLNYLNPIIFYRYVESYIGSKDNALLGFDLRWLVGRNVSVYGQFVLDEFLTKYLFNGSKSWTNKYSLQLGGKYVDALGIKNLDLQAEYNLVRPYTYSHKDGGGNYAHYAQSLAHPLGANFTEFVGIVRYKPFSRISVYGTGMWVNQGKDPANTRLNYGSDIMKSYDTRTGKEWMAARDGGHKIGQGVPVQTIFTDLRISYSLAHNLFLDGRVLVRTTTSNDATFAKKANVLSLAIRYNMEYRQQTY
jgi:hypothetical protein